MPDHKKPIRARIRRLYAPDAIYFITCVTQHRRAIFHNHQTITLLRNTMRDVKKRHPFHMRAYVLLPDHFHLLIHVDPSTDISKIMHAVKRNATFNYKHANAIDGPLTLWQRGYWDHVIRDDRDYTNHAHYIHFNPVKHRLVTRPIDYQHSSFHYYLRAGWYDPDWGSIEPDELKTMNFE